MKQAQGDDDRWDESILKGNIIQIFELLIFINVRPNTSGMSAD